MKNKQGNEQYNKVNEKAIEDYINFLEDYLNLRLFSYQRELLKTLLKQKDNEVLLPYFIRSRQSGMRYFYEFLKRIYGIEYHTELVEMDINKTYENKIHGDEINRWIMEE